MLSRRSFLHRGLAAVWLGLSAGRVRAARFFPPPCSRTGAADLAASNPVRPIQPEQTVDVEGFRFVRRWFGDGFKNDQIPFHRPEAQFPGGVPPEPGERTNIVIVGGGLAGLGAAYLLRHHRPVLLELHDRFGGYSQGESWNGLAYSLGGAYFMVADPGTFLHRLYHQLGLVPLRRVTFGNTDDPFEVEGRYVPAPDFWSARGLPEVEREAFRQYASLVSHYAEHYPDIPLDPDADNGWIRDLDRLTLEQHIRQSITVPIPRRLIAALQGYCYSSFGAGWGEISAAAGWNFIAAEEFGRWVLPGGNAGLARAIWERLRNLETGPSNCPARHLRAGCPVVDVRVAGRDDVRVTYRGSDGVYRAIGARRVVLACPKHVCRHILHDWQTLAPEQYAATYEIDTYPYVVANVLIDRPMAREFYDLFLLGDGTLADMPAEDVPPTDALDGLFAQRGTRERTILTVYWPRPYPTGRFDLIADDGWSVHAQTLARRLPALLDLLGLAPGDVREVRMARWGHAMPIARPNLIADGVLELVRQPFMEHVFFVNQDNWALPAVETSLLEAESMRPLVEAGL
jgi:hypothetical protein